MSNGMQNMFLQLVSVLLVFGPVCKVPSKLMFRANRVNRVTLAELNKQQGQNNK